MMSEESNKFELRKIIEELVDKEKKKPSVTSIKTQVKKVDKSRILQDERLAFISSPCGTETS